MNFHFDKSRNLLIYPLVRGAPLHDLKNPITLNGSHFAVPRTLENSQILRAYNFPVAPIMDDYDWPISPPFKPLAHQKLMANFAVLHPRSFNLTDMGGMKSVAMLWAADWLMLRNPGMKTLIVCPLSIMERVWAKEIFATFLSRRTCEVLYGSHQKRQEILKTSQADFFIINFEGVGLGAHTRGKFELDGFSKILAERNDIGIAVIDEASAYRDSRTKRHRIARIVLGQRPYLWCLTGTPTPNAPTDAYGLARLVNNAFGKSFTTFQFESMRKISQFKWIPQADGYEKARKLLTPAIRFALEDVWDGPEFTTQQRQVELTGEQKRMLTDLKRDLIVKARNGELISAANEAAARIKFIQISLGAIYNSAHDTHLIDASPRIAELKAVINEAPGKILIFAPLTSVVRLLYRELAKHDDRKPTPERNYVEMVYGDTSPKDRTRIFSDFQQSESPRMLISDPACMAHGLDLWAARTVLWYGSTDRAELYAQANRRAYRPGQKWPVTVVQIVSNQLEREIFRRLENHLSLQGALLDAIKQNDFI